MIIYKLWTIIILLKKIFKTILNTLFICFFIIGITLSIYAVTKINQTKLQPFIYNDEQTPSYIYDDNNNVIKQINRKYKLNITYDELPTQFVLALLCAEDLRFFSHEGIDLYRIGASILNNLLSSSIVQGGSTLTQQLIKNTILSNEKTIDRKINEILLAFELEEAMTKEEILEAYCNLILFDGITPGVNNASNRFFGKDINDVNIIEACSLAALVKSPTKYNPLINPKNNYERRNLILKQLLEQGYVTQNLYDYALEVSTEDLLKKEKEDQEIYPYQAYIDIVYQEAYDLTGLDPYTTPMKIYTYLDQNLQSDLDLVAENKTNILIEDDKQQIAAAIIKNDNRSIVGVIGGKNYQGERLLNRAYNVKRQPASTIKPLLSYALAFEHLNWSNVHVLEDVPYTYPGTNTSVKNVDNRYMGEILIEEALGYSRNTTALRTLQEVIDKIGLTKVLDYLEKINMLDNKDYFNMSYGIGGMVEGVTPIMLANAYSIFPCEGIYQKATTIKKIELINKEIVNEKESYSVLSKESAFLMNKTLSNVVNNSYWGMGSFKIDNSDIAMKSGTSSFDKETLAKLGYPNGACKDIWYAGYNKDYSFACWTGFDKNEKNAQTYFKASNDQRIAIAKKIMHRIVNKVCKENRKFNKPDTMYETNIVKGVYPYCLPNEITPDSLITKAYFKKEDIPNKIIEAQPLPDLESVLIYEIDNKTVFVFDYLDKKTNEKQYGKKIYSNEMIYGDVISVIEFMDGTKIKSTEKHIEIQNDDIVKGIVRCYLSYEKKEVETSFKTFIFS